jgi:undecaprenyl-diphosphatase
MTGPGGSGEPAAGTSKAVTQQLADALSRQGGPARDRAAAALRELAAVDQAVYSAVLWLAIAAALGTMGGSAGRRAAVRGTIAIGVTSPLVNLVAKNAWSRRRPERVDDPGERNVRMPTSASFPSGHAASGFAFAAAAGWNQPWLGMSLRFLAAAVAYSRVHNGVHYPGDVVVGALIGAGTGQAVAGPVDRILTRRSSART